MRATRRQEIPRGLHVPKSFKNLWFFLVFWRSHDEGDSKTRDSKRAAYPKILKKNNRFFLGFLKVTKQGVGNVPGHVPGMFRVYAGSGGEGVFINKE